VRATGQPTLKASIREPAFASAARGFWQAAVRTLALDVRYDSRALARCRKTGPWSSSPSSLRRSRRSSFPAGREKCVRIRLLTHSALMRAAEVRDFILPSTFPRRRKRKTNLASRAAARHAARRGGRRRFPAGGVSPRQIDWAQARGRHALAALCLAADPALEGDGRSDLVRRTDSRFFRSPATSARLCVFR